MMSDLAAADAAGDTELAQHIAGKIKTARTPEQPGMLRRALTWATTPPENTKFLGDERKAIVDQYAATHGPAPLGITKDSGDLKTGAYALLSGAVPGSGDVPMGAEADARMQRFRQEHPALSILLPMAGGLGRPGMLPTQRVPKAIDPVLEQIQRVSGAAPSASQTLPEIPKALDFIVPSQAKLAYRILRGIVNKGEGAAASNPYPEEAGTAMRSMGPVPPPATGTQELSPALQAAQAESRARVTLSPTIGQPEATYVPPPRQVAQPSPQAAPVADPAVQAGAEASRARVERWAQAAAQTPPTAPVVEQAAPPVLRAAEQTTEAAPTAASIFEQAGRAKKVQQLVKAIDANAGAHLGVDPRDPRFAEALATLPEQWWDGMGNVAKINKPSTQTIADTTAFFRDRATQAAQAVPRTAAK